MSVGSGISKIASKFNGGFRMFKFIGGFKPNPIGAVLGTSKGKDIQHLNNQLNSLSACQHQAEKFNFPCFIHPEHHVNIEKSITEPGKGIKISFELPIRNSVVTALDFPLHTEKEIKEPGKVISKKAVYMIRVRRRKMRKHKRKKYLKKFRSELFARKLQKKQEKEKNFQMQLRSIFREGEAFSAEKYMDDLLSKVHWKRPVTKVRGQLAPQWVIKKHLEEKEEKQNMEKRIKECSE